MWFILVLINLFVIVSAQNQLQQDSENGTDVRIFGGQFANFGEFPWMVFISATGAGFCGGSLISPSWILTAAECIMNAKSFSLFIGANKESPDPRGLFLTANISIVHSGYKYYKYEHIENNIGLIKLHNPISETEFIKPIRLPKINAGSFEGVSAIAVGTGITGTDKSRKKVSYATMSVISNNECKKKVPNISDGILCCKGNLQHTTTKGDYGGPLIIYEEDSKPTIIGIISFYLQKSELPHTSPSGYTRVTSYLSWIHEKTGISLERLPNLHFDEHFPWMVYIRTNDGDYCAGALINSTWILTTAECIKGKTSFTIAAGSTGPPGSNTLLRESDISIVPDASMSTNHANTIGLIKLHEPIYENDFVKYIRLPKKNSVSFEGTTGTVIGWDTTNNTNLLKIKSYPGIDIASNLSQQFPLGSHGSPSIVYEYDGKPTIIGLTNVLPAKNADPNNIHNDFIKLAPSLQWIQNQTGIVIEDETPTFDFRLEFPWLVYISTEDGDYFGGVLISTSWIAIAAQCIIDKKTFSIITRSTYAMYPNSDEKFLKTSTSIIHEGYKYFSDLDIENNIGLIGLNEPIIPNGLAKPIRLPKVNSGSVEGTPAIIVGWSVAATVNRRKLISSHNMNIISNEECKWTYSTMTAAAICCKGDINQTTVQGDYGDVLIIKEKDGKDTLVGLMTYYSASIRFSASSPISFTRIASFLKWINGKTDIPIEYAPEYRTDEEKMEFDMVLEALMTL